MRREVTLCVTLGLTAALTAFQVNARAAQDPSKPKRQQPQQQPQQQAPGQAQKVDLDELEDKPESYLGKTVTVEGEVDRIRDGSAQVVEGTRNAPLQTVPPAEVPLLGADQVRGVRRRLRRLLA